jgi:predicted ATPase
MRAPGDRYPATRSAFVLIAGWPGSGKSTLAAALATANANGPANLPPSAS